MDWFAVIAFGYNAIKRDKTAMGKEGCKYLVKGNYHHLTDLLMCIYLSI